MARRPELRRLFVVAAAVTALATACGGATDHDAATATTTALPATSTLPSTTTTTTTTAPTTTTTSLDQALRSLLEVSPTGTKAPLIDGYNEQFELAWSLHNISGRALAAWQLRFVVAVTDSLGRHYQLGLVNDCTNHPLAPGARRTGSFASIDSEIAGLGNCTIGVWNANQFIDNEIGLWTAIHDGAKPDVTVEIHRVSFPDGTGVGIAIQ